MAEKIFEAGLDAVALGLRPGVQTLSRGFWSDARNVLFDAFGAHAVPGRQYVQFTDLLFDSASGNFDSATGFFDEVTGTNEELTTLLGGEVTGLNTLFVEGTRRLIIGTRTKLFSYSGSDPATEIGTGFTGYGDGAGARDATRWSFAPWGAWFAATNGVDAAQYWNGSAIGAIPDTPFTRCEVLFAMGPNLVAWNTSNGVGWIEWCANDDLTEWDPSASPSAGNLQARNIRSPGRAAAPLSNGAYALYTETEIRILRRVSAELVFGVFDGPVGFGAVSKNSIVVVGGLHYGLQSNGIFTTDGFSARMMTYPLFGTWLEKAINWEQRSKISGYYSRATNEICWAVPTAGSLHNNLVVRYNLSTGQISFSNLAFTVGLSADFLTYPIVGTQGGAVFAADKLWCDCGTAVERWAQSVPLDFGARNRWKTLDVLQIELDEDQGGLDLTIGTHETVEGEVAWGTPVALDPGVNQIYPNVDGIFFTFKFSRTGTAEWTLARLQGFGTINGRDF